MRKQIGGYTFVEIMVSISIMGIISGLAFVGVKFANNLMKQGAAVSAQQQAQLTLYQITRDVRNAKGIISVEQSKLVLSAYNFRLGYNNPAMFDDANIGKITYEFKKDDNNDTYLLRTIEFIDSLTNSFKIRDQKKLLLNLLSPDVLATDSGSKFMKIQIVGDAGAANTIEISLRTNFGWLKSSPKEYKAQVMTRTGAGY